MADGPGPQAKRRITKLGALCPDSGTWETSNLYRPPSISAPKRSPEQYLLRRTTPPLTLYLAARTGIPTLNFLSPLLQINSTVGAQSKLEDERGNRPRSNCEPMNNIIASIPAASAAIPISAPRNVLNNTLISQPFSFQVPQDTQLRPELEL